MSGTARFERLRLLLRVQVADEVAEGVELDDSVLDASTISVAAAAAVDEVDTAVEEIEDDTDDELLELPLPESRLAKESVTASVNSDTVLPQKVIRRLTLSDWHARWTLVSSGVKKAVLQLESAPETQGRLNIPANVRGLSRTHKKHRVHHRCSHHLHRTERQPGRSRHG